MSDPHIELNNRSYAWIAGLVAFVIMALLSALFVGTGEKVPLSTVYASGGSTESAAGVDGDFGFDDPTDTEAVAASTATIPTAIPTAFPTAIPTLLPTVGATTVPPTVVPPTAVPPTVEPVDNEEPTVAPTADATDQSTEPTTEEEGVDTLLPTPGPDGVVEPTPVPTRTGPGLFRVQDLEAEGATIETNRVTVKLSDNGSGTAVGELKVTWPDGKTLELSFDDSFDYDTNYPDVRVGLDAEFELDSPNDDEDETDQRGSMRIPNPDLRIGAICVATCLTFDY